MTATKSINRIAEIRDGINLDAHLAYARQRLFKEGSVDSSVLEIFSYLKLFQPNYFKEHESDIIEMMGLYFKQSKTNAMCILFSFINLAFTNSAG